MCAHCPIKLLCYPCSTRIKKKEAGGNDDQIRKRWDNVNLPSVWVQLIWRKADKFIKRQMTFPVLLVPYFGFLCVRHARTERCKQTWGWRLKISFPRCSHLCQLTVIAMRTVERGDLGRHFPFVITTRRTRRGDLVFLNFRGQRQKGVVGHFCPVWREKWRSKLLKCSLVMSHCEDSSLRTHGWAARITWKVSQHNHPGFVTRERQQQNGWKSTFEERQKRRLGRLMGRRKLKMMKQQLKRKMYFLIKPPS